MGKKRSRHSAYGLTYCHHTNRTKPTMTTDTRPVTAATVRFLMRRHGVTIAAVAASAGITQARVRHVRQHGGPWDWPLIIERAAQEA